MSYDPIQRRELLALARESIAAALPEGRLTPCARTTLPPQLMERRSSFITLRSRGELRGCCGTLDAPRPLAEDVWRNAWASAFNDHRFPPLSPAEWPHIDVQISVLSQPEPLNARSEGELLAQLRPFIDGLLLEWGGSQATFLPAVWQQLQDSQRFVRQLKLKAGWPADFWAHDVRAYRYTTYSFHE